MLRRNETHCWNNGFETAETDLPEEPILQTVAETAVAFLKRNKTKFSVSKIANISAKQHPTLSSTKILNFSAQIGENDYLPVSILMKKVDGASSIEFQAYSTLFKDLEPNSTKIPYNILQGSQNHGNLYSLIPRPYLIQKTYVLLENLENETFGGFRRVQDSYGQNASSLNLDFNHCLLAVETLARFHATSYMLRRQLGVKGKGKLEMLQKYPFLNQQSTIQQFSFRMNSQLAPVFEQAFELAIKVIQQENPSLAFKLQRKVINPEGIFEKVVKLLEEEKYDNDDFYVVCHGNFLMNNLLFAYDNQEPTACRITNFNSIFFGPLASDLALFLLTCTTLEFRLKFEEKLLAFYCDAFQEQLVLKYGINSPLVEEFGENIDEFHRKVEKQYKKMLEFAFYNVCVLLPLILFTKSTDSTDNNNDFSRDDVCSSIQDLLGGSNIGKYFSNRKDSNFENFVLDNAMFKERLVDILKQLAKNRVLL